ncbi:MAG: hypothetical protein HY237_08240 [Acidobacteria bacterium]|nr:hypothetical protein [Acidobacteriota bacterium]
MSAPERFAAFLLQNPYHPRSNRHSNALVEFLLDDLLESCPRFRIDAEGGKLAYELNRKVRVGTSEWNVDLVVGPPAALTSGGVRSRSIVRSQPSTFRIACEAKSIMTEHRKAQRNRQRDLDALHHFMHRYDQNTIAAAATVVNTAEFFRSPLRSEVTRHKKPLDLVRASIELLRMIPMRTNPSNGPGLEANAVILIEYDNSGRKVVSHVHDVPPAPQPGDPLHWGSFVRRICDLYTQRWGRP